MATDDKISPAFEHVPGNPGGHFIICIYAAVYRLLYQVYRLSDIGGESLDQIFNRFPFLGDYFNEMRGLMPDRISWEEGTHWWRQQLEMWEADCNDHLPLKALAQHAGLDYSSRLAFMLVGLVEEDSRFGTLFARLQEPLVHRRPTLEMVGQILMDEVMVGEVDPWSICSPLLDMGLLQAPDRSAARSEWALRVPPTLWDAARGKLQVRPGMGFAFMPEDGLKDMSALIAEDELLRRITKLPDLIGHSIVRHVVLRAVQGSSTEQTLGAIAKSLQLGLLSIEQESLDDELSVIIGPLAIMTKSMPVFNYDLGPGESVSLPALPGYSGPVGIVMGPEGGVRTESLQKAISLFLPFPDIAQRQRHWQIALGEAPGERADDIRAIAESFRLPGAYIEQTAGIALAHAGLHGRDRVALDDVREASRALNRQMLDRLATHLDANGSWDTLIVGDGTLQRLLELYRRCRNREKLVGHLGPGFGSNSNCGVRALLTGASGTGKTLAAKIIAAELGMDLYRVDLAAIVNKYIGETEKNLHKILSRAEALDVVLLLDEGDALLGNRTDVKSANDRYANLETNYLLQRLENYQGIVLITTNLMQNIDRAFQRRMDILIPFFVPQAAERLQILQLHLPVDHRVDDKMLELAAAQCALSGAQLRNVAMHATLAALEDDAPLSWALLEAALRSEYRKAGGTYPMDSFVDKEKPDVDMQRFIGALNTG